MSNLLNTIAVTAGWWACILGVVYGRPWLGPITVGLHLVLHVANTERRMHESVYLIGAVLLGFAADTALAASGSISFSATGDSLSPLWMVALWPNLATTTSRSLRVLQDRAILTSIVGAVSGPFAYWGGAELGAITLTGGGSLVWIGVVWAFALPLLFKFAPSRLSHGADSSGVEAAA